MENSGEENVSEANKLEINKYEELVEQLGGRFELYTELITIQFHIAWQFIDLNQIETYFSEAELEGFNQVLEIVEKVKKLKKEDTKDYRDKVIELNRVTPERVDLLKKLNQIINETTVFEFASALFKSTDQHFQTVVNLKYEDFTEAYSFDSSLNEADYWTKYIASLESSLRTDISWVTFGKKSLTYLSNYSNFIAIRSSLVSEKDTLKGVSPEDEIERLREKYVIPNLLELLEIATSDAHNKYSHSLSDFIAMNIEKILEVKNDLLFLERLREENPYRIGITANQAPIERIEWVGKQVELAELFIELLKKRYISSIPSNISEHFENANTIQQILKPAQEKSGEYLPTYDQVYRAGYKVRFSTIKRTTKVK